METNRFDAITKVFAERRSRRSTIKGGAIGLGAAVLDGAVIQSARAQDATPDATGVDATPAAGEDAGSSFLFVQTASAGTFRTNPDAGKAAAPGDGTPTAGVGADYLLTLENHTGETVYFSDRPERVFGQAPTQKFLDGLGFAQDNPPNAAIVAQTDGGEDVLVVELFDPAFDEKAGTLTYGANVLKGKQAVSGLAYAEAKQQDGTIAAEFNNASLFIDSCADKHLYCYSNEKGVPAGWRGDLGVYNMCFTFSDLACTPCGPDSWQRADRDCHAKYPDQCPALYSCFTNPA